MNDAISASPGVPGPEGAAGHITGGVSGTGLQRGGSNPDGHYSDASAWAIDCFAP